MQDALKVCCKICHDRIIDCIAWSFLFHVQICHPTWHVAQLVQFCQILTRVELCRLLSAWQALGSEPIPPKHLNLTGGPQLMKLGRLEYLNPRFHSSHTIWPVGFQVCRAWRAGAVLSP